MLVAAETLQYCLQYCNEFAILADIFQNLQRVPSCPNAATVLQFPKHCWIDSAPKYIATNWCCVAGFGL